MFRLPRRLLCLDWPKSYGQDWSVSILLTISI